VFSVGEEQKANPGAVEAVLQHPTDADKVRVHGVVCRDDR